MRHPQPSCGVADIALSGPAPKRWVQALAVGDHSKALAQLRPETGVGNCFSATGSRCSRRRRLCGHARHKPIGGIKALADPAGCFADGASEARRGAAEREQNTKSSLVNESRSAFGVSAWLISSSYAARKCLSRAACAETLILPPQCRREARKRRRYPTEGVGYPLLRHRQST
jgi:hypothetical protein